MLLVLQWHKYMIHKPKKILCVSVSAGSGHVRAAEALVQECRDQGIEAEHIDMMDYVPGPYKAAIVRTYSILLKQAPSMWGLLYEGTNALSSNSRIAKLSEKLADMNVSRFLQKIKDIAPTDIISTHLLPAKIIGMHRTELHIETPVHLVVTDYDTHSFIISPHIDHYFVATKKMKLKLIEAGVPETHVSLSGIPIDKKFFAPYSTKELKRKEGYSESDPLFLFLSGGEGLINPTRAVQSLFRLPYKATIIAIAGKNKELEHELRSLTPPEHIRYESIGWTNEIEIYMRMAQVIISKPGGLTTTECIVLKKPLIAIQPIPGQEEKNTEFILEMGYGVVARSLSDLMYYLSEKKDTLGWGYEKEKKNPLQNGAKRIIESVLSSEHSH